MEADVEIGETGGHEIWVSEKTEDGEAVVDGDDDDIGVGVDPVVEWPVLGSAESGYV